MKKLLTTFLSGFLLISLPVLAADSDYTQTQNKVDDVNNNPKSSHLKTVRKKITDFLIKVVLIMKGIPRVPPVPAHQRAQALDHQARRPIQPVLQVVVVHLQRISIVLLNECINRLNGGFLPIKTRP